MAASTDHRHVGGGGQRVADAGLVVRRLLGRRDRAAGRHHLGQEHLEGARTVGVALEEALLLEHLELVGDAGGAGQADGVADLPHAGRVAPLLDRVLDVGEHADLARGEAGRVRGAVGELADLVTRARGLTGGACLLGGHGAAFRFATVDPGEPGLVFPP
jgi:hypothetical protein